MSRALDQHAAAPLRASITLVLGVLLLCVCATPAAFAQTAKPETCNRPAIGSEAPEPADLDSQAGVLQVDLALRNGPGANGQMRYCYVTADGTQSPTLRLLPGDLLILRLKNELTESAAQSATVHQHAADKTNLTTDPCQRGEMTALATNLHFHGLAIAPVCHQDEVLKTAINPSDAPFEYRVRIPVDQPPGVYWYHPHIHGFTNTEVLGGASGAIVVEGIERANPEVAGLPERVIVIRDQDLLNPDAQPVQTDSMPPPLVFRDAEGDILNTGTGGGKPAKDLSINFVPVPYPEYAPATILVKPSERQLWRILNASALTYVDLQLVAGNTPQFFGVVSLDGVPINENGMAADRVLWTDHVFLPPAARVEFIFKGLAKGAQVNLITRSVDTGPAGENDPVRPLANIVASDSAPEPQAQLAASPEPLPVNAAVWASVWLGNVKPARTRKLYFSERPQDPGSPGSPTVFMLTVDGKAPAPFDPHATEPDITVRQGEVDDWVIENRSTEEHTFHIHQVHFILAQWNGAAVDEPFLRDTINVPYWKGKGTAYPNITLRMDFRDPNAVGTFLYHCHLLEHEDGGMMGTIRVLPAAAAQRSIGREP